MQQINLYTEAFRPQKVVLSLAQILLITSCTIIVVVVATLFLNANLAKLEKRSQHEKLRIDKLSSQLVILEEKAKLLRQDDSLMAANQRLSKKLSARRQMIEMLDSVVVKDDEGFSNILLSLARQKTEGLWLTNIQLGASGKNMTIEGTTLNANAVPAYLQNLRQENGFIGRAFTLFNLDADPGKPNRLDFSLRSQASQSNEVMILEDANEMTMNDSKMLSESMKKHVNVTKDLLP
ncbi:MAG: Tfp pilus assembly protein PilN [Oleiphilaceae bacterium]|jgi:Tfp pilus assembly protein PilN